MEDIIFKGDSRTDSQTFILRQTSLTIIGGVGPGKERTIRLSDISPEFQVFTKRLKRFYLVPLFLSGLTGVVAWRLFQHSTLLVEAVAGIVGVLALGFLLAIKIEPVEGVSFKNNRNAVEFSLYRPFKAAHTYDEFMSALVCRINRAKEVISREGKPNGCAQRSERPGASSPKSCDH